MRSAGQSGPFLLKTGWQFIYLNGYFWKSLAPLAGRFLGSISFPRIFMAQTEQQHFERKATAKCWCVLLQHTPNELLWRERICIYMNRWGSFHTQCFIHAVWLNLESIFSNVRFIIKFAIVSLSITISTACNGHTQLNVAPIFIREINTRDDMPVLLKNYDILLWCTRLIITRILFLNRLTRTKRKTNIVSTSSRGQSSTR